MKKIKVLMTGFNPFGGEKINPSFEAVKLIELEQKNVVLYKAELPTVFYKGAETLLEKVKELSPNIVVCVGQAGGRKKLTVEKMAINYMHGTAFDNNGFMPQHQKIEESGDVALETKADVGKLVSKANRFGCIASVSYHAGTFVCNEVYYRLLHAIKENELPTVGLFIHVPFLPEQAKDETTPTMELDTIKSGIESILTELIEWVKQKEKEGGV